MPDHSSFAELAIRLINKHGREVIFKKIAGGPSAPPADPAKPWRGVSSPAPRTDDYGCKAVFVIPQTSIPTESRGLGFDWINADLMAQVREVCLVAADGAPSNFHNEYQIFVDGGVEHSIIWGQLLRPGDQALLYVLGVTR